MNFVFVLLQLSFYWSTLLMTVLDFFFYTHIRTYFVTVFRESVVETIYLVESIFAVNHAQFAVVL